MNLLPVILAAASLAACCVRPGTGDTHSDIGHDEDTHPDIHSDTHADMIDTNTDTDTHYMPDTHTDTHPDMHAEAHEDASDADSDTQKDDHEDADWHPPNFYPDTHRDLRPDAPAASRGRSTDGNNPQVHCGEFSSQVTRSGQCRLMATLPGVGPQGKRCPDIFRCSDEVSRWHHENQDRKEKLEGLRETISGLQEELRSHRRRVNALEMQGESVDVNSSLDVRLHSLELHQEEAETLLHVHAALLYQLRAELQNLSSVLERVRPDPACRVKFLQPGTLLGLQGALHSDVHHTTGCPVDCASLYYNGVHRSGVYAVVPSLGATPLEVYCDMETEGGGWTVFQRRRDGSVSFNRGWREYRDGFGEPQGEHWLGNRHLHLLSTQGHYSLRIDLEDWTHKHRYALYQTFSTEDEQNQFRVHVSGFSGTVEDSFGWYHDKQAFSTPDTGNICAEISHAGWWYNQCFYANLNGVYYKGGRYSPKAQNLLGPDGIVWFSWKDSDYYSLKAVSMMIRPRGFRPRLSP